jgi:NitT/TauT family transport system substrate-binding protein
MKSQHAHGMHRREFLSGLTLGGMAGLLGLHAQPAAAEPPPETTTLRLDRRPSLCSAPKYVAEELLRGEGFANVSYIELDTVPAHKALAAGEIDLTVMFVGPSIMRIGFPGENVKFCTVGSPPCSQ